MAIGYRREAAEAWSQAQDLPASYQRRFLEALDEDPKCNALEVLSSLKEELQRELRPFDDEAANDALEDVRTISHSAAAKFKSVYETLGDTIPLADILQRIKANYGPSARTIALEEQRKQEELERQRKLERERVEQVRREREPSEHERRQEERNPKILTILVIHERVEPAIQQQSRSQIWRGVRLSSLNRHSFFKKCKVRLSIG